MRYLRLRRQLWQAHRDLDNAITEQARLTTALTESEAKRATTRFQLARLGDECERKNTLIAAKERETDALRTALKQLGEQLHSTQVGPLGEEAPMPRAPSIDVTRPGDAGELLVLPFPPPGWT